MDRYIALSVMYFSLGLILHTFSQNDIVHRFQYNISEIGLYMDFNELFSTYTGGYFNIGLDSLLVSLQYVSKFYMMDFDCNPPSKSVLNIPNIEPV